MHAMNPQPLRYRRTVLKADGSTHTEELELKRDDHRLRGTELSFYELINGWNTVAARGFKLGHAVYLFSVVYVNLETPAYRGSLNRWHRAA
jgi:hypothetical protein